LRRRDIPQYGRGVKKSHWTTHYLVSRAIVAARRRLFPGEPWLTAQAIRLLGRAITPSLTGVEFGSGASTLWLSRRCAHLTSIEHDPEWHACVARRLQDAGVTNVELRLRRTGAEYEDAIDDIAAIDFALIDGKRRHVCMTKCIARLRPGGILILDNADRHLPPRTDEWRAIHDMLEGWKMVDTSNGVWKTTIWRKPDDP
jgi:predicted O-methyltransferase YrrM